MKYFDKTNSSHTYSVSSAEEYSTEFDKEKAACSAFLSDTSAPGTCSEETSYLSVRDKKCNIPETIGSKSNLNNANCSNNDDDDGDGILTLIKTFPAIDVQLLNDVLISNNYDVQRTIMFFQ